MIMLVPAEDEGEKSSYMCLPLYSFCTVLRQNPTLEYKSGCEVDTGYYIRRDRGVV
jgi:hypothetical protein